MLFVSMGYTQPDRAVNWLRALHGQAAEVFHFAAHLFVFQFSEFYGLPTRFTIFTKSGHTY